MLWPQFDWMGFVTELMGKVGIQVESNETVIMRTPDYFSNLTMLYTATKERWEGVGGGWGLGSGEGG